MQLPDDITETSTISELTTPTINTDSSSVLSVDSSTTGTSPSDSSSSDSMETSDDDSSDSMSLSSNDTNEDSSSDYHPSSSESSDSSTIMDTSEDELSEEEQQITKKRKRNPLDSFCLYTIRPKCPNDTNLYIGSTVNFNRRKQQHKKAVTNKRGGTYYCILYRYIRKCGGWDNFTMEKILDYPCETKHEGLLKEKEYIIKHEATLNSVMPVASTRLDVSQARSTVSDFTERMNDI